MVTTQRQGEAQRMCRIIAFATVVGFVCLGGCGGMSEQEYDEVKRLGEHCIVGGFSDAFVKSVKTQLRDPNSFEHIETRIDPVGPDGNHQIGMRFRSRNGFGGMDEVTAIGTVDNETCSRTTLTELA
jgi:hypothetical protein